MRAMHIEATQGAILLRLGAAFTARDAERVAETLRTFAPLSRVTLDFGQVRSFEDAAFFPVVKALGALAKVEVVLRGLTLHHARLLRYLGVPSWCVTGPVGSSPT